MSEKIPRYLRMTAVQGAADGFIEASVDTDIIPSSGMALRIVEMIVSWANATFAITGDGLEVFFSLARDSQVAPININDTECLMHEEFSMAFNTSGLVMVPGVRYYQ